MNTIERLGAHMKELDDAQVHGAGVEAVMEAGKRRQRRRMAGMAVAGVAVVALMGLGAAALQSAITDEPNDVADGSRDRSDTGLITGDLEWVAYESPLAYTSQLIAGDGTVYAISTAPGTRGMQPNEVPQAIYATTDGESWSHEVLSADLWIRDLDARGDTLYAIGTAPGVSLLDEGAASVLVGTSDDGGGSWSYTDIPLEASPPVDLPVDFFSTETSIAVGDDAIVAAVTSQFFGDFRRLAPPEFTGDDFDVVATGEGIRVLDYSLMAAAEEDCWAEAELRGFDGGGEIRIEADDDLGDVDVAEPETEVPADGDLVAGDCVVALSDPSLGDDLDDDLIVFTATWEELGIEGGDLAVSELFVSTDGTSFERIDSPFPATYGLQVVAADGGFLASAFDPPGIGMWFSADGRSWEEAAGLPGIEWLQSLGMLNGEIVAVGADQGRPVVVSAPAAGGPWTIHDLPLDQGVEATSADVSPTGVALGVATFDPATGEQRSAIVHSADLDSWDVSELTDIVGARSAYVQGVVVSGGRVEATLAMSTDSDRGETTNLWSVGVPKG